jgi:hypothetical protein
LLLPIFFAPDIVVLIQQFKEGYVKEIERLERRRVQIIKEMSSIRTMRKGSVTEQYLKVPHKGKRQPALRGPYFLYTRKEKGKTVGRRLNKEQAYQFRQQVEAFHRFQALGKQYAEISERLADLATVAEASGLEKKRPRSPSSKTKN